MHRVARVRGESNGSFWVDRLVGKAGSSCFTPLTKPTKCVYRSQIISKSLEENHFKSVSYTGLDVMKKRSIYLCFPIIRKLHGHTQFLLSMLNFCVIRI